MMWILKGTLLLASVAVIVIITWAIIISAILGGIAGIIESFKSDKEDGSGK